MSTAERPWSAPVRVNDVPETGRHVELEANEATRAALADPAGVDAVEALTAAFDLTRRGRDGLHVRGRVRGKVRQICVVTLEPLVNAVDEAVDVDFMPPRDEGSRSLEAEVELATSDEPEPLLGEAVDLGVLATEFLILGIDPYPRRPDVAFEAPAEKSDPARNPFAALEALKKGTVKE